MKDIDYGKIPNGEYCYEHNRKMLTINNRVFKDQDTVLAVSGPYLIPTTSNCPYWNRNHDGTFYCSATGTTSEWGDLVLLWDQVKCCGYNLENDDNDLWETPTLTREELSDIIYILSEQIMDCNNPDNIDAYNYHVRDGFTYRLSAYMIEDIIG